MKVDECFGATIAGEGAIAGCVTTFVRLGGCDYRCHFCDSMHAVDPANVGNWREMSAREICDELHRIAPNYPMGAWVTISGGNPAIWQTELPELVSVLNAAGWAINIETQGSVPNEAFLLADMVTISPKGPSSGMVTRYDKLSECIAQAADRAVLKFVVGSDADFAFAKEVAVCYPDIPVYVQPVTVDSAGGKAFPGYRDLCEKVANDRSLCEWRVIPQLHVLAWGGERGR